MIAKLTIENFKAFAHAEIPLGSYTLLSGLNSSGKSTVLQALALLRQAYDAGRLGQPPEGLPLNGELVQLGIGQDVLHEDFVAEEGDGPRVGFGLEVPEFEQAGVIRAHYGREDDLLSLESDALFVSDSQFRNHVSLFASGFQYLKADRISPAVTYPRSHEMVVGRGFLGTQGEYTIDFLRQNQDEVVSESALHHPHASPRLLDQVEAWMGEICPGVRISTAAIEQTDLVRLGFQFTREARVATNARRPTNVGFGLTYVLPIVVACLTAKPRSMILLENPEAHVHPRGQSALAGLTCAAATAGAQMIVETHSDHILNGVRLAVKDDQIPAGDVRLLYFHRQADGIIDIVTPDIGPDGMLSEWPQGFFDEWDRSLDRLLD